MLQTFSKKAVNSFELDYGHYVSTPDHTWDAIARFTNINLQLILDIEENQFIKSTIRGGISKICKGYAEANNTFLKSYDADKSTSYIIYLDASTRFFFISNAFFQLSVSVA